MITGWEWLPVVFGVLVQNGKKTFKSLLWPQRLLEGIACF